MEFAKPVDIYGLNSGQKHNISMGIMIEDDDDVHVDDQSVPLLGKISPPKTHKSMTRDAASDIVDIQIQPIPCLSILGTFACCPCSVLPGAACFTVSPREEVAITHLGVLTSVVKEEGCHITYPFGRNMSRISTKQESMFLPEMKVADATGSPVVVSAVINYRVVDSKKALLNVTNLKSYCNMNAQAVLKQIVGCYTYDQLKSEQEVVNQSMLARLRPILTVAGVSVQSMNLNELNYAPEIASGMLKKQQAAALIQARKLIVEGAVRIAQDAVRMLAEGQEAVVMTNDQKVQLISNLLTVTCSDVDATPTVALK
jgi:regulator of protease activity HflC (stomatin/prohibitin superfamily)